MIAAIPLPPLPAHSAFASPEFIKALAELRAYRDGGKPAAWQAEDSWSMAAAHTIFLSLLMRVYALADWAVEHDDLANYLGFASVTFAHLHGHHHFEEEFFFPFIEKSIDNYASDPRLTQNVNEHRIFDTQLADAWVYIHTCRNGLIPRPAPGPTSPPTEFITASTSESPSYIDPTAGFSAEKLRAQMDSWIGTLARHLAAEIQTLDGDWIGQMGKEKHDALERGVEAHLKENDPKWFLPASIGSIPIGVAKQLIALPMPVRRVLLPFVFASKYWGFWKYLEYPQNLTFGGSA